MPSYKAYLIYCLSMTGTVQGSKAGFKSNSLCNPTCLSQYVWHSPLVPKPNDAAQQKLRVAQQKFRLAQQRSRFVLDLLHTLTYQRLCCISATHVGLYGFDRELQQAWNKDSFLKSGGTAKNSKRRSENFNELFAACHAAEDRLKDLTLKHGRAVKAVAPGSNRRQQENVVPTAKRRDALRYV